MFFLFSTSLAFAQTNCSEGFYTDPATGRCVQAKLNVGETEQTADEVKNDLLDKLNETNDPNQVKDLAKEIADNATKDNQTKNSTAAQVAIAAASAAAPTMISVGMATSMIANKCTAPSGIAMMAAGGTVFAGEVLNIIKFKKRKKKLEEDMKKLIVEYKTLENPTIDQKKAFTSRLQAEAFEIMAMAEDAVGNAAGAKQTAHAIASGIYFAAAATAGLEAASVIGNVGVCTPTPSGTGVAVDLAFANVGGALVSLITKGSKTMSAASATAIGRAGVATAAGILSSTIAGQAKKQKQGAEKRARDIRELKMAFVYGDDWGECLPEDRNSPDKPQCYCFTEDWAKNPARSQSQVCNEHWGMTYAPEETNYNSFLAANGGAQSCITKDYKDDPRCNCRNTNSCLSLPIGNLNLQSFPGIQTAARSNAEIANKFFQGKLEEGDLAKLENGNAAFNKKNIIDALAKNPQTKNIANKLALSTKKFDQQLSNQVAAAARSSGGARGSGTGALESPFAAKVASELKTTVVNKDVVVNSSTVQKGNAKISVPSFDLDFSSLTPSADGTSGIKIVREPARSPQSYGSKNSPVAQDEGQSIFKVITDRYHQTGIKKLFAKRKEIKAE